MVRTEWSALEVSTYGKLDYAYKPVCEKAEKLFAQFKQYKGIERKTMSASLLAELVNMAGMQGLEVDLVCVEVKEMAVHKRKLSVGDSIIKAVKPNTKNIFDI